MTLALIFSDLQLMPIYSWVY